MTVTVLLVEDEALIAMGIGQAISDVTGAQVVIAPTIADAERELDRGEIACALLDVHVRRETTFGLARRLAARSVPFAFMSGTCGESIPEDLQGARFLAKPFRIREVVELLALAPRARSATP